MQVFRAPLGSSTCGKGRHPGPSEEGPAAPAHCRGTVAGRQARNAGRFKHCPCTAGCTAQPHPHPRDRELGAALTPNPCSRAGSPLTFSLGGGPSMLLLSSQGGPGRPRLGGLCLPACPAPTALFCTRCSSCSAITLSPWAHFVWGWGVDSWTGCL